ncbi:MAG: hypothetical protein MO846_08240 [Candidatus Devosia symbiotica]|nr:hypothetical protein [Candidatus Devosia symbiotica]
MPYLTQDFPYLRLDPVILIAWDISFELAATPQGFMAHGQRMEFEDVEPLDLRVVGLVAVSRAGGRNRKGAGLSIWKRRFFAN